MRTSTKRILICMAIFGLGSFLRVGDVLSQDQRDGLLIMKLVDQKMAVVSERGEGPTVFEGEILFRIMKRKESTRFVLDEFSLHGHGVETKNGETGNISIIMAPGGGKTGFNRDRGILESKFMVHVHYPLIDRMKGFKEPGKGEMEMDDIRSFTEVFEAHLKVAIPDMPNIVEKQMTMMEEAKVSLELALKERVLGEITRIEAELKLEGIITFERFHLQRSIDIQPVFIRYTPADGCFGGSTRATTGGSLETLRAAAIEMWNRCCIKLNFLAPVYVEDDDYRILSSAEESSLRGEYDDANAVEVFFVEVGDPVGIHGGGVCYSGGTSNTQVITYDTNLPINVYNLAHELGHALDLSHPPGNSTAGSLMEPSGFCADNPALMSDQNCDNASNPLLKIKWPPFILCRRTTNMP